ncbi:MAG: TIGR03663 family protein, partial [Anaerolineae bacterium]
MEFAEEVRESAPWLTVERLGYMIAGLLAAALRFAQLGLRPLNEAEAVQALAALRFAEGTLRSAPAGTIPGLFTGNVLAFTLAGTGDAVARWLPALAGVILVLLPHGLRYRLGRGGALAASFLLALSPSALYFSRNLDGAIVVAACGLALVVGLVNVIDRRRPGYLYLAAGALGLGVSAGPGIYTVLLIVVAFVLLLYLRERRGEQGDGGTVPAVWAEWKDERGLLARAGGVLLATFGLAAMTFMLQPSGVGHAADLLGDWAKSFLPESGGQPAIYPLLLLLRYELVIVVFGLIEIGRWLATRRSRAEDAMEAQPSFPLTALLVFWAVAALLVIVVSGHRPAGNVLLVVVPLALLAGKGVERAWRWIPWPRLWLEIGMITLAALGLIIFLYLQIAAYVEMGGTAVASFAGIELYAGWAYLILAGVALVALVLLWVGAWIWRGRSLLLGSGWLAVLLLLGLWCVKAMWGPAFARASDPREL